MFGYLQKIFGTSISSERFVFPKGTPVYIRDGYAAERITVSGYSFLVVTPADGDIHLPALKKQYANILKISDLPVALNLPYLTAAQRTNLIESGIPFMSLPYQIFLPFMGCMFTNRFNNKSEEKKQMSAGSQLVYLYLLYRKGESPANHKEICEKLRLSKAGGTRAIHELAGFRLITQTPDGTGKWIRLSKDSIDKAVPKMVSPVQKNLYLKTIPAEIPYKYGGIRALSMKTMITADEHDGSIVFSKEGARLIPSDVIMTSETFNDFGGIRAEIWKYDPDLLSSGPTVDDISLLAALRNDDDERIQKELDSIRTKYGLIS
ncbi:MAG: MarR family transcriptional regulator [Anaerolineaceae bacterium]|nr:MarR family transcriptional regulator [Anaerolineaceae bacterium]